jgi:threonine/homoserine/homoserine lactone efflux protein
VISTLLKSLFLGFFFTLPLGPIGVQCVRRILEFGRLYGFILGLSQVLVALTYGVIAVLSTGWFSEFIMKYQFWLRMIGGLILIGFGVVIFFSKSSKAKKEKKALQKGLLADFLSIAGLMLASPQVLLGFLVLFAVLGLYQATTLVQHIEVLSGIVIGSIISWSLVCLCFAGYKKTAPQKVLIWVNRSAGILQVGLGVAVCISAAFTTDDSPKLTPASSVAMEAGVVEVDSLLNIYD